MKPKTIIAGFGCIGKTTLAQKDDRFIDLESSEYKYIVDDELLAMPKEARKGRTNRVKNKEFPKNYFNEIVKHMYDKYVLISMHHEIIDLLEQNDIDYIMVYPEEKMLDEIIKICKNRGNGNEYIAGVRDAYYRLYPKDLSKVYWLKNGECLEDIVDSIIK